MDDALEPRNNETRNALRLVASFVADDFVYVYSKYLAFVHVSYVWVMDWKLCLPSLQP